jgi:hypothetical protein
MDSRCARAAYNHDTESKQWLGKAKKRGLVRRVSVVIDEITAHPPDFTKLFVLVSVESLECGPVEIDERVLVEKVVIVIVLRIGMECSTLR